MENEEIQIDKRVFSENKFIVSATYHPSNDCITVTTNSNIKVNMSVNEFYDIYPNVEDSGLTYKEILKDIIKQFKDDSI